MKFPFALSLCLTLGFLPPVLAGSPPPAIATKPTSVASNLKGDRAAQGQFVRFLKNFFQAEAYRSQSHLAIQARGMGMDMTFQANIQASLTYPDRLRATVEFLDDQDQVGRSYEIASDGETLTLVSPTLGQHSQQPYSSDAVEEQLWMLGFANLLYLTLPGEVRQELAKVDATDEEVLAALNTPDQTWNWQFLGRDAEGDRYELVLPEDGSSTRLEFLLDPVTADLKAITTTGEDADFQISITESEIKRQEVSDFPAETFELAIPDNSEAVEQLEIAPL